MNTTTETTVTESFNRETTTAEYAVRDEKGRVVGGILTIIHWPEDAAAGVWKANVQAARRGLKSKTVVRYGACQPSSFFRSIEEARAWGLRKLSEQEKAYLKKYAPNRTAASAAAAGF
jgi:hypothetical protein